MLNLVDSKRIFKCQNITITETLWLWVISTFIFLKLSVCEIHEYCSLNMNDCKEGMRFPPRFYLPTVKAEHMISGRGLYKYSLPPHLENPLFSGKHSESGQHAAEGLLHHLDSAVGHRCCCRLVTLAKITIKITSIGSSFTHLLIPSRNLKWKAWLMIKSELCGWLKKCHRLAGNIFLCVFFCVFRKIQSRCV